MKKLLIVVIALSTSLLFAQQKSIIESYYEEYNSNLEKIILDEFENIVIKPPVENVNKNIEEQLEEEPVDLIEAQTIVNTLDETLIDLTLEKLVESSAQKIAIDLQSIIQEAIFKSIEKSLVSENPSEEIIVPEEIVVPEEVVVPEEIVVPEEEQIIIADNEVTETDIVIVKESELAIIEPLIEEPVITTTSDAPDKINYVSSGTIKSTQPTISQTIHLSVGDYTDVILNGEGWIFLGEREESTKPPVSFYNRYMDGIDSYFGFDAINPGTTTLHFYKQDIIGRTYLDEYVKIVVKQKKATNNSYKSKQEEAFGISAEPVVSLAGGETAVVVHDTAITDYGFVPETILDEAEMAYNEGNFDDSIALLDEYISMGKNEVDRALYLYAKNYESSTTARNVKLSHSYYKKVVQTFPDSKYYDESEKRILYLERFYIIIR